jgi:capsular polysaccharide biosynthesis protein
VFTTLPSTSLILAAGAQSSSPTQAQRIATAFVDQLQQFIIQRQVQSAIPDDFRVIPTVVVAPRTSVKLSPTDRKRVTIGTVAGLVALIVILGVAIPISRRFR